jgi:fructokinase
MSKDGSILCFGEIVWDALPRGVFLGGAPLNVAYHLNRLGRRALQVSRVGADFLGAETLRRLRAAGVATDLIQIDDDAATGAVVVSLDRAGDASYEILHPVAWDRIAGTPELESAAASAEALVYGTLATRSESNAALLSRLLDAVPFRLCDVNLRRPHDDPANALKWAARASVIKLNEEELEQLAPEAGDKARLGERAAALSARTGVGTIVVTRGGKGAAVLHDGAFTSRPSPKVEVADTVGAGDAFTAAFLDGLLKDGDPVGALDAALRLGAFVASRHGAQPEHEGM